MSLPLHARLAALLRSRLATKSGQPATGLAPAASRLLAATNVMAASIAITICGFVAWGIHSERLGELESNARSAANVALIMEQHAENVFDRADAILRDIAYRVSYAHDVGFDTTHAIRDAVRTLRVGAPYRNVYWVDAEGTVIVSIRRAAVGQSASDRDYFKAHSARQFDHTFVGTPVIAPTDGTLFIPVSLAVRDASGTLLGVAVVAIDPAQLGGKAARLDLGATGAAKVLRSDGVILGRIPYTREVVGTHYEFGGELTAAAKGQLIGQLLVRHEDGSTRSIIYRADNPWDLIITVGIDLDAALERWRRQSACLLFVVALVLVGVAAVTVTLRRLIVSLDQARQVADRARLVAERESQAKDTFLANMSHELRTPLNAVIGFAEIMRERMFGPLHDRYRTYADDIWASGKHLLTLVETLLDLAKVDADRLPIRLEIIDLDHVTAMVFKELSLASDSNRIRIQRDFQRPLPVLWADPLAARQVLTNLVSNAIKFTPPGGVVALNAGTNPDGSVWLQVRDTGAGMTSQQLAHVGQRFFQPDAMLSRERGGNGLGLALVKGLMKAHQGTLEITSAPGVGTIATVTFPGPPEVRLTA